MCVINQLVRCLDYVIILRPGSKKSRIPFLVTEYSDTVSERLQSSIAQGLKCFANPVTAPIPTYPLRLLHSTSSILPLRSLRPKQRRNAMAAPSLHASSSSALGTSDDAALKISSNDAVGEADLLIIGPGVLGRIVAEKWKQENPGCQVFGQTITTDHHDELVKIGITPSLKGTETAHFPFVIFCAPPSRSADYPGDVRLAASRWNGEGSFLFTSSSAVYDCNDNGLCNEDTPVVPIGRNPRTDVLLKAENAVLEVGGCVVRLAGLYKLDRGAHAYWLEKGTVDARPDHILNLIHYEDAASLSIAIMKKKLRSRIFMGCDSHPLSRQEIMDCMSRSEKFSKKFEGFTGTDGPLGKRMNNSKTRAELGWEPKYKSFPQFLELTD